MRKIDVFKLVLSNSKQLRSMITSLTWPDSLNPQCISLTSSTILIKTIQLPGEVPRVKYWI